VLVEVERTHPLVLKSEIPTKVEKENKANQ
jgi:hypothetical protein